jgi:hypothetical protein
VTLAGLAGYDAIAGTDAVSPCIYLLKLQSNPIIFVKIEEWATALKVVL